MTRLQQNTSTKTSAHRVNLGVYEPCCGSLNTLKSPEVRSALEALKSKDEKSEKGLTLCMRTHTCIRSFPTYLVTLAGALSPLTPDHLSCGAILLQMLSTRLASLDPTGRGRYSVAARLGGGPYDSAGDDDPFTSVVEEHSAHRICCRHCHSRSRILTTSAAQAREYGRMYFANLSCLILQSSELFLHAIDAPRVPEADLTYYK